MFHGWSEEGIKEYNSIISYIKEGRKTGKKFEEDFQSDQIFYIEGSSQKQASDYYNNIGLNKQVCNVACYDDLSDDSDNDIENTPPQEMSQDLCSTAEVTPEKYHSIYPSMPGLTDSPFSQVSPRIRHV